MPTKAIYEAFDDDESIEFDHFLAERLGWRSVEDLRRGMSAGEWLAWWVYYGRKGQRMQMAAEQAKG